MLQRYSPVLAILGAAATVTGLSGLWAGDGTVPLPAVLFAAAALVLSALAPAGQSEAALAQYRLAAPFGQVTLGLALALLSLFLTWYTPEPYKLITGKRVGTVTEVRDRTGAVVQRIDTTSIRPDVRFVNFDSSSGFQTAGPVVVFLLVAALALGFAGLRRGAAHRWQATAGLLLLAALGGLRGRLPALQRSLLLVVNPPAHPSPAAPPQPRVFATSTR